MSSHREAPEISKDPVADSTDLYAFTSYGNPDNVTIIANYVPLQAPDGGPNFYEFGDDVLYEIKIDNNGDGKADVTYQFTFTTQVTNANTFLYNTGPILSLTDKNWNRRQTFTVVRVDDKRQEETLGTDLACPPCNIGPLSTPNYETLVTSAVHALPAAGSVFAGQRAEGFYVDLGAIFDLGILRPFQQLHTTFGLAEHRARRDGGGSELHQGRQRALDRDRGPEDGRWPRAVPTPTDATSPASVIGVWTTASRQKARVLKAGGTDVASGPYVQVSRLGNPLVNEVVVPMAKKDFWNSQEPADDKQFTPAVLNPELAQLLPVLYPGVFPNLEAYNKGTPKRDDLVAIFHTGLPSGVVAGFQNSMGTVQADMLRLNLAVPPTKHGREQPRSDRQRPRRLPERSSRVRRRHRRSSCARSRAQRSRSSTRRFTPDAAAGQITDGLTSGPTDHERHGDRELPARVPLPRHPVQRVRGSGGMIDGPRARPWRHRPRSA